MHAPIESADVFVRDHWGAPSAADGLGADDAGLIAAAMLDQPRRAGDKICLPSAPWQARISLGTTGRAAMELYAAGTLLDVVVATELADEVLCGARRAVWDRRHLAIAWGRRPVPDANAPGRHDVAVSFARGGHRMRWARRRNRDFRQDARVADIVGVTGWFWVAVADGRFDTVTVTRHGKQARRRLVTVHPRPDC
jgi:hypothetical protein